MSDPADLLLWWMSHQGDVSDAVLRSATDSLLYQRDEENRLLFFRTFRRRLYLLAHTSDKGGRLRVASPCLLMMPEGTNDSSEAVFIGGRVPSVILEWENAAKANQCALATETIRSAPTRFSLLGSQDNISLVATMLNIPIIRDAPLQALRLANDIERTSRYPQLTLPPTGVQADVYDLETGQWLPSEPKVNDVCRYKPAKASTSYFTLFAEGFAKANSAGEAVFLSAHRRRFSLCSYEAEVQQFITPRALPDEVAKALSLCSCRLPKLVMDSNKYAYSNISQAMANAVQKQLGQCIPAQATPSQEVSGRHSLVHWLD